MRKLTLEFPPDLVEALRLPPAEQGKHLQQELAVRL